MSLPFYNQFGGVFTNPVALKFCEFLLILIGVASMDPKSHPLFFLRTDLSLLWAVNLLWHTHLRFLEALWLRGSIRHQLKAFWDLSKGSHSRTFGGFAASYLVSLGECPTGWKGECACWKWEAISFPNQACPGPSVFPLNSACKLNSSVAHRLFIHTIKRS